MVSIKASDHPPCQFSSFRRVFPPVASSPATGERLDPWNREDVA